MALIHADPLSQWERMKAVVKRWVDGDTAALDAVPDGSEPGSRRRR